MSWDIGYEETKVIDGIGTAYIVSKCDDWNRHDTRVDLDSKTHHIESVFGGHGGHYYEEFYAVPNGKSLESAVDKPHASFNNFSEILCNKFSFSRLESFLKSLTGKRSKFVYPMSSRNLLYFLAYEYYNYYGNIDREKCLSDVSNALSIYKSYKFNFEIYRDRLKKSS